MLRPDMGGQMMRVGHISLRVHLSDLVDQLDICVGQHPTERVPLSHYDEDDRAAMRQFTLPMNGPTALLQAVNVGQLHIVEEHGTTLLQAVAGCMNNRQMAGCALLHAIPYLGMPDAHTLRLDKDHPTAPVRFDIYFSANTKVEKTIFYCRSDYGLWFLMEHLQPALAIISPPPPPLTHSQSKEAKELRASDPSVQYSLGGLLKDMESTGYSTMEQPSGLKVNLRKFQVTEQAWLQE